MKIKHILTVFKKELKDMIRDKRTIVSTIIVPMIILPVLYFFMGNGVDSIEKDVTENLTVGIVNYTENKEDFLKNNIFIQGEAIKINNTEDAKEELKKGNIRIAIEIDENYEEKLLNNEKINVKVYYDSTKMTSSSSVSIIENYFNIFNSNLLVKRLSSLGINPDIITPTVIENMDVAPEEVKGNTTLSMIVPMLLAVLLATAGAPAAIDLIVGERERKTFEPLLSTKADRLSILLGKYFAISTFSAISLISSMMGVFIGMKVSPSMFGENLSIVSNTSVVAIILAILAVILFGFICSSIQMILSAFAKTIKEGNTYVSFLTFAIMIPAYATMFMQPGDVETYMAFIPALNIIALLKMVIGNMLDYNYIILTVLSSIVFLVICLIITFKLFKKESMVIR